MKKLHSLAFYTLVTPVIALSSGALLAAPETKQDIESEYKSTEQNRDGMKSAPGTAQSNKDKMHNQQADRQKMLGQSLTQNQSYLDAAPANGFQASNLIGADVKSNANENIGPVNDLIINEQGQVVALVVGVGGFLGMGERDVAITWDKVNISGTSDEMELQVDVTREGLSAAPAFELDELNELDD